MNGLRFDRGDPDYVNVIHRGTDAGALKTYLIRPGHSGFAFPLSCRLSSVVSSDERVRIEWKQDEHDVTSVLDLKPIDCGWTGIFRASGNGRAIVRLVWELPSGERGFPFVPAFMYGCNEGGNSPRAMYPQLDNGRNCGDKDPWVSEEWLMRADRSSHGLASVIAEYAAYAVGGRDVCRFGDDAVAEKTGLGISSTDPHRLSFSLGFWNAPFTYSPDPGRNYCHPEGYVNLDAGEVWSEFFILLFGHDGRRAAAARLMRESYELLHDDISGCGEIEEVIGLVGDALIDCQYDQAAKNFYLAVWPDRQVVPTAYLHATAWCGGVRVAYPLLVAGHQTQNDRWLRCAREVFSNIAENAVSEKSGLFNDNYHTLDGWSARGAGYYFLDKPGHSGYVSGQACYYLLMGYLAEKSAGLVRNSWLDSAKRVLGRAAQAQGEDGRFGFTYSEDDGRIIDGNGFSGCWFTSAFAKLFEITGDESHLNIARRAMDFYRQHVEDFTVWGGPLDTPKCPDEEGILAWVEAARILHESTGEKSFLTDLVVGLDYEFSWKFAYNVTNEVEPLKSMNWCSTGGSVTSVNNSHIHPMGSQITDSILYASEKTGDPYFRSRLIDTLRWTLTIYQGDDRPYGWGKRGVVNERFCYTDALLIERFPDGSPASTWFCAHPWAAAVVLEGLVGKTLEAVRQGCIIIAV